MIPEPPHDSSAADFRIGIEDPGSPEVSQLLRDGETYGASLYPTESNHFLPLEALRAPQVRFVVVRNGHGEAVGTGALAAFDGWAELKRMWVVPTARGRGISKLILGFLSEVARRQGLKHLRLETGVRNHEALALYANHGFVHCAAFGEYKPDPLSVFMEKSI